MGVRAEHQRRFQGSGRHGEVVDVGGGAGHVLDRAVVAHLRVDRARDAGPAVHHSATTSSTGSVPARSRHSRMHRFDATRARYAALAR